MNGLRNCASDINVGDTIVYSAVDKPELSYGASVIEATKKTITIGGAIPMRLSFNRATLVGAGKDGIPFEIVGVMRMLRVIPEGEPEPPYVVSYDAEPLLITFDKKEAEKCAAKQHKGYPVLGYKVRTVAEAMDYAYEKGQKDERESHYEDD